MWRPGLLAVVLVGCGGGGAALPCVPEGAHDFFFVRRQDFVTQSGTITFAADRSATLRLGGEPARRCAPASVSDDRAAPIAACQVSWSCEVVECAGCSRWLLGLLYRPAADGVLPQGTVFSVDGTVSGRWSATPEVP